MKYDLIFITTCTSLSHIHYLLLSIANINEKLKVHIVVLFQCGLDSNAVYETSYTTVTKLKCGELYNLSKARNTGIQYVREHDLKASYVMFPDDEAHSTKRFSMTF